MLISVEHPGKLAAVVVWNILSSHMKWHQRLVILDVLGNHTRPTGSKLKSSHRDFDWSLISEELFKEYDHSTLKLIELTLFLLLPRLHVPLHLISLVLLSLCISLFQSLLLLLLLFHQSNFLLLLPSNLLFFCTLLHYFLRSCILWQQFNWFLPIEWLLLIFVCHCYDPRNKCSNFKNQSY